MYDKKKLSNEKKFEMLANLNYIIKIIENNMKCNCTIKAQIFGSL